MTRRAPALAPLLLAACVAAPDAPPAAPVPVPPEVAARLPEGVPPAAVTLAGGCYAYTLSDTSIAVYDQTGSPICL